MDAFKSSEIERMEHGGNEPWKAFFDSHPITLSEGRTFEDSTIKERYEGEVGEEYKERLTAKVEGREYVPGQKSNGNSDHNNKAATSLRSSTPLSGHRRTVSPPTTLDDPASRKERNEAYFAKLGAENAMRPDNLPLSQGGKYSGFGGGMPTSPRSSSQESGIPSIDEFQRDPMGALSKGFGWFTSAVGRGAKTVNETYIQPTAKSVRWMSCPFHLS